MFVVWALMVPMIAASYLASYLRRRKSGHSDSDWSFLRNRRAVGVGLFVAVLLVAPGLASSGTNLIVIPTSILIGAMVALAADRYGPFRDRRKTGSA
jgi:hypothetical protein